jgi:hypothetical protein
VHRFQIKDTIEPKISSWTLNPEHFVVSPKENDVILTEDDVKYLIGNTSDWLQGPSSHEEDSRNFPTAVSRNIPGSDSSFWKTQVCWRNFFFTREKVVEKLIVQQSWVLKENGENIHEVPQEMLKGRLLPCSVVEALLSLPSKDDEKQKDQLHDNNDHMQP